LNGGDDPIARAARRALAATAARCGFPRSTGGVEARMLLLRGDEAIREVWLDCFISELQKQELEASNG
jgi:hypothetical protein